MPRPVGRKTALQARAVYAALVERGGQGATVAELAAACALQPCQVDHALTVMDDLGLLIYEEADAQLPLPLPGFEAEEEAVRLFAYPREEDLRQHPAYTSRAGIKKTAEPAVNAQLIRTLCAIR